MDCKNARKSINGQALLNIDALLATFAFKASANHSFAFDEFIEAVTEIYTSEKSNSSPWDFDTQIHEVVKCAILIVATQTLCFVYQLPSK